MSIDVRFLNETYQLVLCELSRSDPYTFLKDKLSLETCRNIVQEDIEVSCSHLQAQTWRSQLENYALRH